MSQRFNKDLQRVLDGEGITPPELKMMVAQSALFSAMAGFNRRYHHWALQVQDKIVEDMKYVELTRLGFDRGMGVEEEECPDCDGEGCKFCGWHGNILRYRLPSCT
jgi:hypothetical protein